MVIDKQVAQMFSMSSSWYVNGWVLINWAVVLLYLEIFYFSLNLIKIFRQLTEKPIVKRKPLPKLVYNILKDSDLRKKCKELGLNAKGDRRLLVKRHQKYCIIYNSECDLTKPR